MVVEKYCASTRAMMSVPPPGGDGTTMRTGRDGYDCALAPPAARQSPSSAAVKPRTIAPAPSTGRAEELAGALDRLCRHQHERDDAGLGAGIGPVVDGAALHQHVAGAQVYARAVDLHHDLAAHDDRVVDRLGAVVAGGDAGVIHPDAKH